MTGQGKGKGRETAKTVGIAALLAFLGYTGNYLSVPVAYEVTFIFGSIFSIVALSLLGVVRGVVTAALASSYTYILWNHPYAIIVFTCEALWIGLALRRRRNANIIVIDTVFWVAAGAPLVLLFYYFVMGLSSQHVAMILLKQVLNGIFNALAASILISHLPLGRWLGVGPERPAIPFAHVLFHLTTAFLMVPMMGMLFFTNHREAAALERLVVDTVTAEAAEVREVAAVWLSAKLPAARQRTAIAGASAGLGPGEIDLDGMRDHIAKTFGHSRMTVTVTDRHNSIVVSTDPNRRPLDTMTRSGGDVSRSVAPGVFLHVPPARTNVSVMDRWRTAYYFATLPIEIDGADSGWTLTVEAPVAPLQGYFYTSTIQNLAAVLALFLLSLGISRVVSKGLAAAPARLAALSKDLPDKVVNRQTVPWPESRIAEMSDLIGNFRQTADALGGRVREIREANLLLEQRVRERTGALQEKTRQLEDLTRDLEKRVEEEIGQRSRSEQILLQQSKLAAMGEMLGAIAHQWRQPLNTLALCIQNMQDSFLHGEIDRDYIEQTVRKSMEQIRRMSKTIDDFRNFFQPDRERTVFDAMAAAGEVLSLFAGQFETNGISYRLTCHRHGRTFEHFADIVSCPEKMVLGYRNEFEHVLLNLIGNARDAILDRRGRGRMPAEEPGRISFDFYSKGDRVVIAVSDNGGGFEPDALDRVFDPYFTTKGPLKGTGIGLYLSRIIIEDHMQGKLTAENAGAGARITVELPAAPAAAV